MSKGITKEQIQEVISLKLSQLLIDDSPDKNGFRKSDTIADHLHYILPDVLEPLNEGRVRMLIKLGIFYQESCAGVTGTKIEIVGIENVAKSICSKFGQPKLTEAELEKFIESFIKVNRSWNVQPLPKEYWDEIRNTCLKVIRENLRKLTTKKGGRK